MFVNTPVCTSDKLRRMASSELSERFRERFFSVVRKGNQARIAGLAGLDPATISRWRSGAEPLNLRFNTVERLAQALGVQAGWLLGAEESSAPIDESSFLAVPLLRDTVAAGNPRIVSSDVITELPFTRYWIRKRIGAVPGRGRLVLVRVERGWLGESMLPTITPGSMLLVDRGPGGEGLHQVEDGGIYLLLAEDGLTVKRVWKADGGLLCCPDNRTEKHRPFVLKPERMQDAIKGRVILVANQDV